MAQTSSQRPPAIVARGLHKSYGRSGVLKGLDLDVPWGEVVIVLGSNGSGKTTLLSMLPRLLTPQVGTIKIDGVDVSKVDLAKWFEMYNSKITRYDVWI